MSVFILLLIAFSAESGLHYIEKQQRWVKTTCDIAQADTKWTSTVYSPTSIVRSICDNWNCSSCNVSWTIPVEWGSNAASILTMYPYSETMRYISYGTPPNVLNSQVAKVRFDTQEDFDNRNYSQLSQLTYSMNPSPYYSDGNSLHCWVDTDTDTSYTCNCSGLIDGPRLICQKFEGNYCNGTKLSNDFFSKKSKAYICGPYTVPISDGITNDGFSYESIRETFQSTGEMIMGPYPGHCRRRTVSGNELITQDFENSTCGGIPQSESREILPVGSAAMSDEFPPERFSSQVMGSTAPEVGKYDIVIRSFGFWNVSGSQEISKRYVRQVYGLIHEGECVMDLMAGMIGSYRLECVSGILFSTYYSTSWNCEGDYITTNHSRWESEEDFDVLCFTHVTTDDGGDGDGGDGGGDDSSGGIEGGGATGLGVEAIVGIVVGVVLAIVVVVVILVVIGVVVAIVVKQRKGEDVKVQPVSTEMEDSEKKSNANTNENES